MAKVAPPAFAPGNDASQWLLFVGATTTTPLGQVKTFDWTQAITSSDQVRVGDHLLRNWPTRSCHSRIRR